MFRLRSVSTVVAVLVGLAVLPGTVSAAPALLSQGKPVTASSTEGDGTPAAAPSTATAVPVGPVRGATRSGCGSISARPRP